MHATAAVLGAPCAGAAGPIELVADRLPWVGGSYRATASTLPANALAFSVVGRSSTQLAALHPAGEPGCALRTNPDAVLFTAGSGGAVTTGFAIPLDAAFVGVQLWHQVLEVELPAGLAVQRVSASNALAQTIGAL